MGALETFGSVLAWEGTPVYGVQDINGPGMAREVIDITNHSSPDGMREKRTTVMDPGEVSASVYVDPADAGFQAIQAAHDANTTGTLTITAPGGTVFTAEARVGTISYSFPVLGVLQGDVTFVPIEAVTTAFGAGGS